MTERDLPITTVLFDLDGVIRFFPRTHRREVEERHRLPTGTLSETAFAPTLVDRVVAGELTRAEWTSIIGEQIGNVAAAEEWLAERGHADPAMFTLLNHLRSAGYVAAILTNGTDTVEAELAQLRIDRHVDRVFNTWRIGFSKPDVRAFQHVCDELDVDPRQVFFTDDTERKLSGAVELGMTVHHYEGMSGLSEALLEAGITHAGPPQEAIA